MAKINKGFANRFISIIVGISFFFANLSLAYSDSQPISGNSLRLPVGEESTYGRMAETMQMGRSITRRSIVKGIGAAALLATFSSILSYTPSGEEYYIKLAETDPEKALIKFEEYKEQPFVSNVVKMAMKRLGGDRFMDEFHNYPKAFWEYAFSEIWGNTSEQGNIEENKASEILSNIADNPNQSQKEELLSFLAERYPDMFLEVTREYAFRQPAKWEDMEFIKRLYAKKLIDHFIQDYNLGPLFFAGKRIISNGRSRYINSIVSLDKANFTIDAVKSYGGAIGDILTRIAVLKYDPKDALSLIDEIWDAFNMRGILKYEEALSLLRYISLGLIKDINDLYTEEDEIRFASIQDASALQLYILMVYGEEELSTSSFNGIFNRFISKLQNEETSLQEFFVKQNYIKFRTLIKMSSWYGRLNNLLEEISSRDLDFKKSLLQRFIKGLEQEADPLSEAVAAAESFNYIKENLILEILQQTVKSEYERVESNGDHKAKVIYGLLAGLFADNAVVSKDWFKSMGEKYKLPDLKVLSKNILFDSRGVNTQRYFFYDDEDGNSSFNNFLRQYRNDLNWKIEENDEYVRIVSRSGGKIEIYANRPKYKDSGQQKIELLLKKNQQDALIVIHRGHSTYVGNTIKKINSSAVLVGLLSCGGYKNVKKVLEKSRKAHILSTKGKGTAYINGPLLKMINEQIRQGHNIVWEDLWAKAKQRFRTNPDFEQYVQPDKNLGALFFQAYNDEIDKLIDLGNSDSALIGALGAVAWGRVTDGENISRRNFLFGGLFGEGKNETDISSDLKDKLPSIYSRTCP